MIAILYHNKKRLALDLAVRMALRAYEDAEHTRGYPAELCQLHPSQRPSAAEIDGLQIRVSNDVPINYIRICGAQQEVRDV